MLRNRPIPAHNLKTTRSGEVRRRNIFWRWRRLFYLATLMAIVAVTGAGFVVSRVELPTEPPVEAQTTFICTSEVLPGQCDEDNAAATLHGEEDRVNVRLEQMPDVLIDAVVAAEDRDFFEHGGVDPLGIARAAYTDIMGNSASRQGGSTITQQYVKNVYLTDERTLTRKIREAVMAIKLEQEISKEQILENYLNTIYFGRGAYGVQAASQVYFNKDVGDLVLADAALLAGLIRSPHRAEPYTDPEEAKRRRRTVLDAMLEEDKITRDERDEADAVEMNLFGGVIPYEASNSVEVDPLVSQVQGDYFIEYVRAQLAERYGDDTVFGGGLRVYTTLDRTMQGHALTAVTETLNQPGDPVGSLVAIDDAGQVRAMVGGTDFATQKVNLAVGTEGGGSGRQAGSTFKAFALAEAMRQGYSVESLIHSPSSAVFPGANGGADWLVGGGCCGGVTTLTEATARSANTAYAEMMIELGPQAVIDMAHDLGVTAEFPEPFPSLVLGAGDVSVLDMAASYSTFANQGTRIDPRVITRVEDAQGNVIEEFGAQRTQVLDVDQASRVTHALQQVIDHGTGEDADFGRPAAGKTGTTQDNRDAWFVGYTPTLTAAFWMGYPEGNRPMEQLRGETVSGSTFPARIWRRFMELATADTPVAEFPEPADLEFGWPWDVELQESYVPASGSGSGSTGGGTGGTGGGTGTVPSTEPEVTDTAPAEVEPTEPVVPTDPVVPEGAGGDGDLAAPDG
ncbi:PBP1A family penicillin-binding protein [Iamia sp. SCSIO 61187]|uniref:transglycosylase domain-containing protein n=1 Tax=Iamia sp. SCSIO 61187 TaxID=2722752 RepID=UPI001C62B924|nr:PBP1A family penicillin-binding protein [Iamia sp. SCSIO 61187]QYG95279.1 PBP1A family penicillin-binding protein [Iamia sp. SCSIO 61187]